ncbi:MAG: zinc ribbon domain-containing protein [Candidatus Marinimicrobia bacterium]|nr:zinc ribbon domain-containing protein [Candidatus Neomarinimicrobiota bacterium]
MPMYEYRCRNCGNTFDELVSSTAISDSDIECPGCGKYESEKLMSAFASSGGSSVGYSGGASSAGCGSGGFT